MYSYWTADRIPDEDAKASVEEAINEITRDKIGVEVELMPLAASEQAQKVSLAMASGEQIDIFNTVEDLNTYIANNQVYDITDLLQDHAQGAVEQVSEEFLKTTKKDGRIYGIPADKGIALENGMQNWDNRICPDDFDWCGMMTVPRELSLRDGCLIQTPIRELLNYRTRKTEYLKLNLSENASDMEWKGILIFR